mgnify:CR=1 FL=1
MSKDGPLAAMQRFLERWGVLFAFALLVALARLGRIVPRVFSYPYCGIEDFARRYGERRYSRIKSVAVGVVVLALDADDQTPRNAVLVDELQQIDVFDFTGLEGSIKRIAVMQYVQTDGLAHRKCDYEADTQRQ